MKQTTEGDQSESYIDDLKIGLIESMQSISVDCSQKMINIAGRIIRESVHILSSPPPCAFTAVAIGSLARGEATPYSDLEYLFLIETNTPETVEYFERLAVTSYFLLGNLGETKLNYMDIRELQGWFDDTSKSGFKIDGLSVGAGNIPTGNGTPTTTNQFIVTPADLCSQYEKVLNNPNDDAIRGDLTAMLLYMIPIYDHHSKQQLLQELKSMIAAVMPTERRVRANIEMLRGDINKFNFSPDLRLRNQAYTVDVKRQLFRFPSILLFDLSIYYNVVGNTTWDTADLIHSLGKISDQFHRSILFQLACACFIRLSAYLYYDSHDDRISMADTIIRQSYKHKRRKQKRHCERWYVSTGLMLALCNEIIPMKQQLSTTMKTIPLTCAMYGPEDVSSATILNILLFSGRYSQALDALLCRIPTVTSKPLDMKTLRDSFGEETRMLNLTAEILYRNSHFHVALRLYKCINEQEPGDAVKLNMAECYRRLSLYAKALDVLDQCQEQSADLLYNRGRIYMELTQFDAAEESFVQALQLYYDQVPANEASRDYYGNSFRSARNECQISLTGMSPLDRLKHIHNLSPELVDCIHALGQVYWKQGKNELRDCYEKKYQELALSLYGANSLVPQAADTYNNLGLNCMDRQNYDIAHEYLHSL